MTNNGFSVTTRGEREILITRTFNAPREMVWDAMTKPEHLRRWLVGPPGWTATACEDDTRVGGKYRMAWQGPKGEAMAMSGVYREVVRPSRIVRTESFEFGCVPQAGEQIATMELVASGDERTDLRIVVVYPSRDARDATVKSGMEHGIRAGYDKLDELLASVAASA